MSRQARLPGMSVGDGPQPAADVAAQPAVEVTAQPAAEVTAQPASDDSAAAVEPRSPSAPSSLTGQTVYVIDANSLIFQVFHAIPEMSSPRGEPVAAVFGFARDILFLLEQKKPDYLFVAFDRPEPTFRHEFYEAYKAHRSEMPVDLIPQFPSIWRLLAALDIAVLDSAGYEADDLLATIARQTDELDGACFLVSADKDCRQLITERVKIFNVRKNQVFDACALLEDWGVRPEQVVDFQALVGDAVDNVPGVPLIGPKIARVLLEKYASLDQLLEKVDELPKGKRKENLIAFREQALLSRRLVKLDRHVPVELDWSAARVGRGGHPEQVAELCAEFGFHSLAERLKRLAGSRGEQTSAPATEIGPPQSAPQVPSTTAAVGQESAAPAAPTVEVDYRAVDTPQKLIEFVALLSAQPRFSFDTETTNIWPRWAEIVGYSFCWQDGVAWYLPVRAPAGEPHVDAADALACLRPILEDPAVKKIGQNLKYDMIVLRAAGVHLVGVEFDTMVASYLLDAGERSHNLDELSKRYLNHTTIKIAELIGSGKNQKRMDEVSVPLVTRYAAEDADMAWRLWPLLAARLAESGLMTLFETLEIPLIDALVEMESNGIRIDVGRLAALSTQYGQILTELETEIYALAGRTFNIGSPKQLQQVLFEEHKLPIIKRSKTGGSTDVEVLEELARQHPLPAKIIEYRQNSKLKNTYVDALPHMVHPGTGRVHTSFNQVVAATGRLSSNDPNLQNIPVRHERGREIRAAFLPREEGWQLLAADYSQIELRVLAHYSGDAELRAAFARDDDIHALVASQVYGVPLAEVTSEMRRGAKAVNFGVIYGQSPFGLAKTLNIPQGDAARFIDAYFDRYRGVEEFLWRILEDCRRNEYVSTILGRRRAIRGIRNASGRQRNLPERTAINTVIQGSAADLIKLAMIKIHRRLPVAGLAARMLLQIHDELVFEVPSSEIDALASLVAEEMATAVPLSVPVKVDVKVGPNWAAVEPIDMTHP